jgi:hypothetical protein
MIRDDLLGIIGYAAEVSLSDDQPIVAFYTDRHLSPILERLVTYVVQQRTDARAGAREQIAIDIEARCDRLSHRERIATPPEWPVCAKCMPYFNIAKGDNA